MVDTLVGVPVTMVDAMQEVALHVTVTRSHAATRSYSTCTAGHPCCSYTISDTKNSFQCFDRYTTVVRIIMLIKTQRDSHMPGAAGIRAGRQQRKR